MKYILLSLFAFFLGCTPEIHLRDLKPDPIIIHDGSLSGRVCAESGRTWLPDAKVYLNVVNDADVIIETKIAYTDVDGYWKINDLPGSREYTYYVQYGPEVLETDTVFIDSGVDYVIAPPDCFDPLTLNVAVVQGDYDDFDLVLTQMGFANYVLIDGQDESELTTFLDDPTELAKYDIIFFNGGFKEERVIYHLAGSLTDKELLAECKAGSCPASRMTNIRNYVENGGNIYASDWAYDVVEIGWPDRADFVGTDEIPDSAQLGNYVSTNAPISDDSLSEFLGTKFLQITYDLPVWPPVSSVTESVSVHVKGNVEYSVGLSTYPLNAVPLLYSFNSGNGKVVFSTFRVARNANEDVVSTLQYMMYRL